MSDYMGGTPMDSMEQVTEKIAREAAERRARRIANTRTYQIVWANGNIEELRACQVLMPQPPNPFRPDAEKPRWTFHGETDAGWTLLLSADDADIRSVRMIED